MFGRKRLCLQIEKGITKNDVVFLNNSGGKMLSLFTSKEILPYIPEIATLEPGESMNIEVKVKRGRR